jgi:hypothetical protein
MAGKFTDTLCAPHWRGKLPDRSSVFLDGDMGLSAFIGTPQWGIQPLFQATYIL